MSHPGADPLLDHERRRIPERVQAGVVIGCLLLGTLVGCTRGAVSLKHDLQDRSRPVEHPPASGQGY